MGIFRGRGIECDAARGVRVALCCAVLYIYIFISICIWFIYLRYIYIYEFLYAVLYGICIGWFLYLLEGVGRFLGAFFPFFLDVLLPMHFFL